MNVLYRPYQWNHCPTQMDLVRGTVRFCFWPEEHQNTPQRLYIHTCLAINPFNYLPPEGSANYLNCIFNDLSPLKQRVKQ